MSDFPILDLVVGLIFVFFLLSIISSSAVEIVLTVVKARSKILEEWLKRIFDKKIREKSGQEITLGQAIMDHCAAIALAEKGKAPSYIDAKNFTSALLEKITYNEQDPKSIARNMNDIITALENTNLLSTEIKRSLLSYAQEAKDTYQALTVKTISEVEYFTNKVETWFDTSMDRLTGTFKRKYTQPLTMLFAAITALALNADSIAIAKYLYSKPEVAKQLAMSANNAVKDSLFVKRLNEVQAANHNDSMTLVEIKDNVNKSVRIINDANTALNSTIPLGWKPITTGISFREVLIKITGLLATILAIFMGAPFWFDILNKIANLRGTGPKPPSTTGSDANDSKDKK